MRAGRGNADGLGMSSIPHGAAAPRRLPGLSTGRVIGVIGALVLVAGLSRPFYMLLPAGSDPGPTSSAGLTEHLIDLLLGRSGPSVHGSPLDAWTAFRFMDVALAGGAVLSALVLASGLAVAAVAPLSRLAWLFGMGAVAAVAYRLVQHPLPEEALTVGGGAWMVLAGAAATALGGWLATQSD